MFFRRLIVASLAFSLGSPSFAAAEKQAPSGQETQLEEIEKVLTEGMHEVAALKAQRLLSRGKWKPTEAARIGSLTAEALIRAGKGKAALEFLATRPATDGDFWKGQALLLVGDFAQAETVFNRYGGKFSELAQAGIAHALLGQGRIAAARGKMRPLRESGDEAIAKHARLFFNELEIGVKSSTVSERLVREPGESEAPARAVYAKTLIDLGQTNQAEVLLKKLLDDPTKRGMTAHIHDSATVLLAEAQWRKGSPDARATLISFINSFQTEESECWTEAFDLLDRMASEGSEDGALLATVIGWATDATLPLRQGHAYWLLGQDLHRIGRDQEAVGVLEALLVLQPAHPRGGDAMRLLMQLHGNARADQRVLQLAGQWQQQFGGGESAVDFLIGLIRFMRGEYLESMAAFRQAAEVEYFEPRRRRALYNAAVCAFHAGEPAVLTAVLAQLAEVNPDSAMKTPSNDSASDLQLDEALHLAGKADPGAELKLRDFLEQHPQRGRRAEAAVALAEFCLLDVPPRIKPAQEALDLAVAAIPQSRHIEERISYVRLWMREAQQDLAAVAREGQLYLSHWPSSPRSDEVHMKVAEAYYRLENYARARTEFELLANNRPGSAFADAALYFAGLSALSLSSDEGINSALSLWNELATRDGPLAFAARRLQAVATGRFGDGTSALALFDALLEDPLAKGEQGLSVMVEKAGLLIRLGQKSPARAEQAVVLLRGLLADKSLAYLWSARCSVLLATALRDLKRSAEAQEACYEVIESGSNPVTAPTTPEEYLWYYRAGFLTVDLLEESEQWEAAARIAERLARSSGDRAQEAAERASKIRLKHYLWDGTSSATIPSAAQETTSPAPRQ